MRRIWLDDVREAPRGWHRVRTAREAIGVLRCGGRTDEISLDHDLYDQPVPRPGTGMDVLRWILRRAQEGRWDCVPSTIHVHTVNDEAAARMAFVKRQIEQEQARRRR